MLLSLCISSLETAISVFFQQHNNINVKQTLYSEMQADKLSHSRITITVLYRNRIINPVGVKTTNLQLVFTSGLKQTGAFSQLDVNRVDAVN